MREFLLANVLCYIWADISQEATPMKTNLPLPLALFLGLATCLVAQQTRQLTPLEQTLLANERAVNDVSGDRGLDRWSDLVADDAIAVYDSGFATKAEVISAIRTMHDVHYSMDNIEVIPINENAGLITYRMMQDWQTEGHRLNRQYYVSSLWLKRNGKWVSPFWQETDKAADSAPTDPAGELAFFVTKEREDWEALKHKDKLAAARLLADDFTGLYNTGFSTKAEWIKQMDKQYTIDDYTIEDAKLLRPSPTTALLLYNSRCKGSGAWVEYCSHISRISDLMVQRDGEWRDLFSQDTRATSGDQDDATVLKEILASENRIVDALARDDIEGFARLLPEDVMDIDDDGVHTKAEWIPEIQEQKDKGYLFRDFRFDDPKLIRLGPDQATFTAKEIIHGLEKGKPFELRYYTNATYVRRDGKWVPRVYQDTPMVK